MFYFFPVFGEFDSEALTSFLASISPYVVRGLILMAIVYGFFYACRRV